MIRSMAIWPALAISVITGAGCTSTVGHVSVSDGGSDLASVANADLTAGGGDLASVANADLTGVMGLDLSSAPDLSSTGSNPDLALPPITACVKSCTSPADCAIDNGADSASNFSCDRGACKYLGCKSNAECQTSFGRPNYACTSVGSSVAYCTTSCTSLSDCASDSGAFSANNFQCAQGACVYLGCVNDGQCQTSFQSSAYVCKSGIHAVPSCVKSCTTPSDCAVDTGAYSASNYACRGGACVYVGCGSDTQCQVTYHMSNYVCR